MIVYQGYIAKSFGGLDFMEDNGLEEYYDKKAPVVVFGGHYSDTIQVISNHKGTVILNWAGADSKRARDIHFYNKNNIIHVTTMPKVREMLASKGIACHLIRHSRKKKARALIKGAGVFTYIHHRDKAKYNMETVSKIKTPYEILIMSLDIPYKKWYGGECDRCYGQSFTGLALSTFTGATACVVEMGMRGMKVVTNIVNMPHCIPWESVSDIEKSIEQESVTIGTKDDELAEAVANEMIIGAKGFDLKKLILT